MQAGTLTTHCRLTAGANTRVQPRCGKVYVHSDWQASARSAIALFVRNAGSVVLTQTIVRLSMAFSGFYPEVLPGEICQNVTYGAWQTISGRFYRWRKKGIWQSILQKLQQQADHSGKMNWSINFVDGSVVRAHQHAAGAIQGEVDPNSELSAIEQVHYS